MSEFLRLWVCVFGFIAGLIAATLGLFWLAALVYHHGGPIALGVYCLLVFSGVIAAIVVTDDGEGW
jgi:hypothetical protein